MQIRRMRLVTLLPLLAVACALPLDRALALPSGEKRVLRVVAPSVENESYRKQAALLLPAWTGLLERDFVIETQFGAPRFMVTLIGKDGGEKLRREVPLVPEELFAVVDAMPMRRAEMKSKPPGSR